MEGLKGKIFYSAIGLTSGLTGFLNLSGCSGGACSSCVGCGAGIGIGILLIAVIKKLKGENNDNGVA